MNFLALLISVLILIESGGNPTAIGDNGHALGCLQIHAAVVQDVNRIYGTQYTHQAALNPRHAKRICELYLRHYAGSNATAEKCARIWNGGPSGYKKRSTLKYWGKVKPIYGAVPNNRVLTLSISREVT